MTRPAGRGRLPNIAGQARSDQEVLEIFTGRDRIFSKPMVRPTRNRNDPQEVTREEPLDNTTVNTGNNARENPNATTNRNLAAPENCHPVVSERFPKRLNVYPKAGTHIPRRGRKDVYTKGRTNVQEHADDAWDKHR